MFRCQVPTDQVSSPPPLSTTPKSSSVVRAKVAVVCAGVACRPPSVVVAAPPMYRDRNQCTTHTTWLYLDPRTAQWVEFPRRTCVILEKHHIHVRGGKPCTIELHDAEFKIDFADMRAIDTRNYHRAVPIRREGGPAAAPLPSPPASPPVAAPAPAPVESPPQPPLHYETQPPLAPPTAAPLAFAAPQVQSCPGGCVSEGPEVALSPNAPPPPPASRPKVTVVGKRGNFAIGKILSGHFWNTNFRVPDPPPPPPALLSSNVSLSRGSRAQGRQHALIRVRMSVYL